MRRTISFTILMLCSVFAAKAQPSQAELEKQRAQLRKEIQEAEKMLSENKKQTQESYLQWKLVNNKVELQNKLVTTINKDLRRMDDNIYIIQKDINRYTRILDTLKQEYAKSMVYAYKNRSSYDFLNFIFSADNFNDAVKRVAYLRSYRDYRKMQGENISRMLDVRQKRIEDLAGAKKQKNETLVVQSTELGELKKQEDEKDRMVNELKKQGSKLNNDLATKQKRMQSVRAAILAAIRKAQEEARKLALAKAAEEEKRRREEERIATAKRLEEERRRAEADRIAKANAGTNKPSTTVPVTPKPVTPTVTRPERPAPAKPQSVLLNTGETVALNSRFESNRGSLPWPVDNGYPVMHYGKNTLPSGQPYMTSCTSISAAVGTPVKSIFDGEVSKVLEIDGTYTVIIKHGKYFSTYSNITGVSVSAGSPIRTGQVIGKVAQGEEGGGLIELYLSDENREYDPENWMRKRG